MSHPKSIVPSLFLGLILAAFCGLPSQSTLGQDPEKIPGAPHLLPEGTFAYIRLDNADDLREELGNSSVGRMLRDPQMRPFAGDLYKTMRELFEQVSDEVGVSLDELLSIPSGQVAAAFMPGKLRDPKERAGIEEPVDEDDDSDRAIRRRLRRKREAENSLAGVFIIDAGDNADKLLTIIQRLESLGIRDGFIRRETKIGKTPVTRLLSPRQGRPDVEFFERDGVVVFGIGYRSAQDVLERWLEKSEDPTLADSSNFSAVMARCVGAESTRPQLTFYIDPYHIAERFVMRSESLTARMAIWPLVESLGLAKIRGIGASSFSGGEVFEGIGHLHVLIDPPRDGLLGVLRPEKGDSTPPDWVPGELTAYTSVYWNIEKTYENLGKVVDTFQAGENSMKGFVEDPLKKQTGLDVQEDLLENITGRYVRVTWMEPPARLNSQCSVHGIELKDPIAAKEVIAKLRKRFPKVVTPETVGGKVVYFGPTNDRMPKQFRKPQPGLMILDNWLIAGDSKKLFQLVIRANAGQAKRLVEVPEYDLVASELGDKLDGEKPFMVSYGETADMFRQIYELAQSDDSKQFLSRAGENNMVARKVSDLIKRHKLPPYEEFEKYFAPSGTFGYDEPSGIHIGTYQLRADND